MIHIHACFFLFENLCFGTLDFDCLIVQREQAIQLVSEAICAGIFNDLGSGSNVDVCVITKVWLYLIRVVSF